MEIFTTEGVTDGYKRAMTKLWSEYWRDEIMNNPTRYLKDVHNDLKEEFLKWHSIRKTVKKYKYVFVVINPKKLVTIQELQKKVNKVISKKWLTSYIYSYEQRSTNIKEMGKGIHINLLIELTKDKSPYSVKDDVYKTFKLYVGNRKHVCIRYSNNPTNFINYILGYKKGDDKLKQVSIDKKWRDKLHLSHYYLSTPPSFLTISLNKIIEDKLRS